MINKKKIFDFYNMFCCEGFFLWTFVFFQIKIFVLNIVIIVVVKLFNIQIV